MLDTFAGDSQLLEEYMRIYSERRQMLSNIELLSQTKSLGEDEIEFLRSRIAAIDAVNPTEESIAELEEKSKLAEAASDIVEKSSAVAEAIDGDGWNTRKTCGGVKICVGNIALFGGGGVAVGASKGGGIRACGHFLRIRESRAVLEYG